MTPTAGSSNSSSSSSPYALQGLAPQGAVQALPPRARTPGGFLISLADLSRMPGKPSLESALRERVAFDDGVNPDEGISLESRAARLILALDQRDATPNADPATCGLAAQWLLELGQDKLLCRLALLNRSLNFQLNVGASAARAGTLERIGIQWPQDVAVHLMLDAGLSRDGLWALQDFMQCPLQLSLSVQAGDGVDVSAAGAIGQVIGHRTLEVLSLNINETSVPFLHGLYGVKAQAIVIVATPTWEAEGGTPETTESDEESAKVVLARAFSPQAIADYELAIMRVVPACGAQVISFPQSQMDAALCARLLATRSHWESVQFSTFDSDDIVKELSTGICTVRQLELNHWDGSGGDMAELLAWTAKIGVSTLVFNGPVNLRALAYGLDMHLLTSAHVFEWIEACFVVNNGDLDNEAFEVNVFDALLHNPSVATLCHKPRAELSGEALFRIDKSPIDAHHRDKLIAMFPTNARVQPVQPVQRLAKLQRALKMRKALAVQEIGRCLSEQKPHALFDCLDELRPPLVKRMELRGRVPTLPANFFQRAFMLFAWFGVEPSLIKSAVAGCVAAQPATGAPLCRALMGSGLPMQTLAAPEWARRGKLYAKTWLVADELQRYETLKNSGQDMKRYEGMTPGIVSLVAPPTHPDPNAPVATTTTTTTTTLTTTTAATTTTTATSSSTAGSDVPGSNAAAVGLPAVHVVLPLADAKDLATLSETQTFDVLMANLRRKAAAFADGSPLRKAIDIILRLLEEGVFDPADMVDKEVGRQLIGQLLQEGQGRLLRHAIHHTPAPYRWPLVINSAAAAMALRDLAPWPQDKGCTCFLQMPFNLSQASAELVEAFALQVPAPQLTLFVLARAHTAPESLERIIKAHRGMLLGLGGAKAADVDAGATVRLLKQVHSTPLHELTLHNLQSDDTGLVNAVTDLVAQSGVKKLRVIQCLPMMSQAVLTCTPWHTLMVMATPAIRQIFDAGRVSAQTLSIGLPKPLDEDSLDMAKAMVGQCNDLKALEFQDGKVDVLWLASCLDVNPSVQSFKGALTVRKPQELAKALAILWRNTSLMRFDLSGHEVDPELAHVLLRVVTRNRLPHPALAALGAGRGFGLSARGLGTGDVGELISPMLARRDVVALSLTNKATYVATRQPWENEVDRLAALISTESPGQFKHDLVRQLTQLDTKNSLPASTLPSAEVPAGTVLERVDLMQSVGVPDFAIGEALRRALSMGAPASRDHVEAMVVVGAYPAELWLKDVMGIDVRAVDAPQA